MRSLTLFGSRAWGTPHADSDVDVCAVIDDLTHHERVQAILIAADVSYDYDVPIALIAYASAEFQYRLDIELRLAEDIASRGVRL